MVAFSTFKSASVLGFPDSLAGKISTSLALLVGQLHCHGGAAAVGRLLDSRIDLGNSAIEVSPDSSSPLTQIQHGFDCCGAQLASEMGHLRPSRAVPSDGSLSPDSCRARRVPLTAEMGQKPTSHAAGAESARAASVTQLLGLVCAAPRSLR